MANKETQQYEVGRFKIDLEDNTEVVKEQLDKKVKKIFYAWGIKWKEIVTPLVPVDTGKLRQSMHFRSLKDSLAIGTNVEYAVFVNNGRKGDAGGKRGKRNSSGNKRKRKKRKHQKMWDGKTPVKFMERSVLEHRETYKRIAEKILKE